MHADSKSFQAIQILHKFYLNLELLGTQLRVIIKLTSLYQRESKFTIG